MKKIISIAAVSIFLTSLIGAGSAYAGAARRHTIEGMMLGAGMAIIGAAIISDMNQDKARAPEYSRHRPHRPDHGRYDSRIPNRYHRPPHRHRGGHWVIEKIWIEPVYETKWNPPHYNRKGEWVEGRYEKFVVSEGYYKKRKVWARY